MMYKISIIFILYIFYSFIGWAWEVIDKLVEEKKFVNRGFLVGPYCPIYGVGCTLLVLLLSKYTDNAISLFVHSIVICSILEYATSYFMEKIFHARWWDYSKQKFNLNGRICAETMIPFGIFGSLVVGYINPFLTHSLERLSPNIIYTTAIILAIIYIVDTIFSFHIILNFRKTMTFIEKDATEQITKKVREILTDRGYFYRRLLKAFPHLENTRDRLIELSERINDELKNLDKKLKIKR